MALEIDRAPRFPEGTTPMLVLLEWTTRLAGEDCKRRRVRGGETCRVLEVPESEWRAYVRMLSEHDSDGTMADGLYRIATHAEPVGAEPSKADEPAAPAASSGPPPAPPAGPYTLVAEAGGDDEDDLPEEEAP